VGLEHLAGEEAVDIAKGDWEKGGGETKRKENGFRLAADLFASAPRPLFNY